jgi:hypothetical protein
VRPGRRTVRRAATLLALATAAVVGGAAARTAQEPAGITFAGAGCSRSLGLVGQSGTGRIAGCIRLGPLDAGPHAVVVEADLGLTPLAAKLPPRVPKGLRKFFLPKEPAVRLTLVPAGGPPGTRVTVTGQLLGPVAARGPRTPIFCWNGCTHGLEDTATAVRWTTPRTFRATLRVPAAPWVQSGPPRVMPLQSGTYPITVQCVVFGKACAAEGPEGTASFALRVARGPAWCPNVTACASLRVTPASARPGDVVKVTGWAPLAGQFGAPQSFGVQVDVVPGRPHGAEVRFVVRKGAVTGRFGHGALTVLAGPAFADLRATRPIAGLAGGLSAIAAQPGDPSTVAWCGQGEIGLSTTGAVARLSTAGVAAALQRMGLQSVGGSPPSCAAVAPAGPATAPAGTIVAAFPAGTSAGAPPVYEIALVTRDAGASWLALPVPPGSLATLFGGFRWAPGGGAQAVFATHVRGGTKLFPAFDIARPLTETTSDGGATWAPGRLTCPAVGPCLTFGPYSAGDCAKGLGFQELLRSTDGGRHWRRPALPDQLYPCGETGLSITGPRTALLVNSSSPYTLERTTDGGVTWNVVTVPRAPGQIAGTGLGFGPGGITALPDGGLLLTGSSGNQAHPPGWLLLRPGGRAWCPVGAPAPRLQHAPQLTPVTVIGSALWWLTGTYDRPPAVNRLPVAAVTCR